MTYIERPGDVLSGTSFGEKGGKAIVVGGRGPLHETTIGLQCL